VLIGAMVFCLLNKYPYTSLIFGILILIALLEWYGFVKREQSFYEKTIKSILQEDFSTHFSSISNKNHEPLIKLYNQLKERQFEKTSQEMIFRNLLDTLDSGVLILNQKHEDWKVFLMNDYFSELFSIPKISDWNHIRNFIPSVFEEVEKTKYLDTKASVNIRFQNENFQTFVMQTSRTNFYNQDYFVLILDPIQKIIDKKEKESWINLMNVISHELMNSLTPIQSLSNSLQSITTQENLDKEDIEDLQNGLQTISNRSNHLQFFVENYRKLASLPSPQKQMTDLSILVSECLSVMQPVLKSENIALHTEIEKVYLEVDRQQLEQVLINLITNSIYSLKNISDKEISIQLAQKDKRISIQITDNGQGVEKEIEKKLFLPFFTTRKEGAGIGLTLSKNIVEAHGGYLYFTSENGKTSFTIQLMKQ
jgi:nitrogen fixation/metabolism regulation signal transduction histidine kinase